MGSADTVGRFIIIFVDLQKIYGLPSYVTLGPRPLALWKLERRFLRVAYSNFPASSSP